MSGRMNRREMLKLTAAGLAGAGLYKGLEHAGALPTFARPADRVEGGKLSVADGWHTGAIRDKGAQWKASELTAVVQHGAFDWLDAPIERVGAKFAPLAFAPKMEQFVIPQPDDVLAAVRRTVAREQ